MGACCKSSIEPMQMVMSASTTHLDRSALSANHREGGKCPAKSPVGSKARRTHTRSIRVVVGRPRVLSRREFVIERGDLVQPIDDLFVGHCGGVATSPFRFLAEERGIGRNRGVR